MDEEQEQYASKTTADQLFEILQQFLGPGILQTIIQQALAPSLEKYFGSSANFGGQGIGGPFPFGTGAIFAPTDVGSNFFVQAQRSTIESSLQGANAIIDERRNAFRESAAGYFLDVDQRTQLGTSAFGFMSDFAFARLQPTQLLAGMGQGNRYLGLMAGDTEGARFEALSSASEALASDFLKNTQRYGGFRGQDIGRLYAEGARSGNLAGTMQIEEEGQRNTQLIESVQKTASAMAEFSSIFKGTITQMQDSLTSLLDTDITATLEDSGRQLALRASTTGFVTNTSPAQMQALAATSANLLNRAGISSFNAMSAGILAAEFEQVGRFTDVDRSFVDPTAYRQRLVQQTTGAMESAFARNISGAYALLVQGGMSESEAADRVQQFTSTVDLVNGIGNQFTLEQIQAAGFSNTARKARMDLGLGGSQALTQSVSVVESIRRQQLEQMFGSSAVGKIEGPLTVENIVDSLNLNPSEEGRIRQLFDRSARARGFQNASAQDVLIASVANTAELDRIRSAISEQSEFKDLLSDRGKNFGIGSVIAALNNSSEADGQSLIKILMGDARLNPEDFEKILPNLNALNDSEDTLVKGGAELALRGLYTNQIYGQTLTQSQREKAIAILKSDEPNRAKLAKDFALEFSGEDLYEAAVQNQTKLLMEQDGNTLSEEAAQTKAEELVTLTQIESLGNDLSSASLSADDLRSFKNTYKARLEALRNGADFTFGENGMMQEEAFRRAVVDIGTEYASVYAVGESGKGQDVSGALLVVLKKLADLLSSVVITPGQQGGTTQTNVISAARELSQ